MKSINPTRTLRHLAIVTFLLTSVFYLPVSGQIITNFLNQIQARRLYDDGLRLFNQGTEESYIQALPKFQESARLYLEINAEVSAGISLLSAGAILDKLGEKMSAIEHYEKALSLFKNRNKKGEAFALSNMGAVYFDIGDNQKALEHLKEAFHLCKQINDTKCIATTLNNIGESYAISGDNQRALDHFKQALDLTKLIGFKNGEALSLSNIGRIYHLSGENQIALNYYNDALFLMRQTNDNGGKALILNNMGKLYSSSGENQKALDHHNLALSLNKQIGNKNNEAATYNHIGGVYYLLGEHQKALEFHYKAVPLDKKTGDKRNGGATLHNIGTIYSSLGKLQKALDYFKESLSLNQQIKNKIGEASTLHNTGIVYNYLNDKQKALNYFNRAIQIRKEIGDKAGQASTLNSIGLFYLLAGEKHKALNYYNQALLLEREVNDKRGESVTLSSIMVVWKALNNIKLAIFYGKQSINIRQHLRNSLQSLDYEVQKSFLRNIQNTYKVLAGLLVEESRLNESIQILNFYQNQQYFDFNQNSRLSENAYLSPLESKFAELYKTAGDKIGRIIFQIGEIKRQINNGQGNDQLIKNLQNLERSLNLANNEFLTVLKKGETEFDESANEKNENSNASQVTEMQSVLRQLKNSTKQETATLYTLIGEKKFYVLLITARGNVKVFESLIDRQDFNDKLIQFYALLQRPAYDPRILGEELYKTIIPQQLEDELKKQNIQTLMWQLDGNLRYIPISALWDGEKYMVEKYQNVVLTRADSQRLLKETKPQWVGVGFGTNEEQQIDLLNDGNKNDFPGLSGVKEELENIFVTNDKDKGILKGEVYANKDFTKEKFYEAMKKRPQIAHISSHFRFYAGDSTLSFLVLGNGKALTLNEMKDEKGLFEGIDLLTLSACETGAVLPNADGREIDGFAELAQRLGANSVMASLWQVPEYSTSELMTKFYSNKLKAKLNKAESLRLAQLSLIKGNFQDKTEVGNQENLKGEGIEKNKYFKIYNKIDKKYRPPYEAPPGTLYAHPYYWSPFILFGNWK